MSRSDASILARVVDEDWSWDKLPQDYTSLPIFTLDPDLLDEVEHTCRSHGTQPTVSSAAGRNDVPQPPTAELPADEETTSHSASAMSTSVHMIQVQKKIRSSLCTLTSLSYRVVNDNCLRVMKAPTLLVRCLKAHATSTLAFLHPVQCKKFVSAGSNLRKRLSALRR